MPPACSAPVTIKKLTGSRGVVGTIRIEDSIRCAREPEGRCAYIAASGDSISIYELDPDSGIGDLLLELPPGAMNIVLAPAGDQILPDRLSDY